MSRRYRRWRNAGHERALQYIRGARSLSAELGGTDEDVKRYFFSLSGDALNKLLSEYAQAHGWTAANYARETIPYWKSGKRHMSGMVASRLYALLPPHMPIDTRLKLLETLWKKYSPSSDTLVLVGPDACEADIITTVENHLVAGILHFKAPQPLEQRFQWLSAGNVYVQLLNHFLDFEKASILDGVRKTLPTILAQLLKHGDVTQQISHHLAIGKHNVQILFDPTSSGIRFGEPGVVKLSMNGGRKLLTLINFKCQCGHSWPVHRNMIGLKKVCEHCGEEWQFNKSDFRVPWLRSGCAAQLCLILSVVVSILLYLFQLRLFSVP